MNTTPKQLGKYELVERLGHGGMAEVWKAFDPQLQRYVAIKILHPNLRDDPNFGNHFQREARLIASLHHPNIVQIHDFQNFQPADDDKGEQPPITYMVMNYVEGQTLANYIRNTSSRGQIPSPTEIVNLFTSISQAIDYAHQQGMMHRDIKPANILLDQRNTTHNTMGEPILTDFGVAALLSTSTASLSEPQLGTPLYISPEQACGYPGDERSDLYSLGVILYEIMTGVTPFRGDTPFDIVTQHVNATPTAPALINPRISPSLSQVIMRCLAKDPATRFASASSLTIALADALNVPRPEMPGHPAYSPDTEAMPTQNVPRPEILSYSAEAEDILTLNVPVASFPVRESVPTGSQANIPNTILTPVLTSATPTPPVLPSTPSPIDTPKRHVAWGWNRNSFYTILLPLLIVILLGGGMGTYVFLTQRAPSVASNIVGHAFYVSSGQLVNGTDEGITDRIQIDLQDIPDPQPGKSYYAWLLADKNPETYKGHAVPPPIKPPLLLTNNLPVHNKQVNFTYGGDGHNNNLLSATSRILITEESANRTPTAPSQDRATWLYYGELPQEQIPNDAPGFSALIHIRHLFYNETNINVLGLPGGLDNWMLKNTEKVFEWSISARDDWHGAATTRAQLNLMWQQFIRILDYLDGIPNIHVDMPSGTPVLVDHVIGRVALLTVDPQHQVVSNYEVDPPGYVDHVQLHVGQIARAPDISPAMRQLTARILDEIGRAKNWLKAVHNDALKLFQVGSKLSRLKQGTVVNQLDQLVTDATYAYIGQLDPLTNTVQGAMIQAHYDMQQLATLPITRNLPPSL